MRSGLGPGSSFVVNRVSRQAPLVTPAGLPGLAEGAQFDAEGPGGAVLVGDAVQLLRYRRGLAKKSSGLPGASTSRVRGVSIAASMMK